MSATGLLVLNFCDLILLTTSQRYYLTTSSATKSELGFRQAKNDSISSYITQIYNAPYHVLIVYNNLYCSGSLIRSKIVVTAASCFVKVASFQYTTVIVKVGSSTVTDIGQVIQVLEVKKHEYFKRASDLDNDIALLMLKDHVKFSTDVMKIPLIGNQDVIKVRTSLNGCGWGSTNLDLKYTNRLLCTDMTLVNNSRCWKLYKRFLSKSNFCVKYERKYRLSDNGGPVVYRDRLVGLISYGADRNEKPYIALVTNITHYDRWINVNVQKFLQKYCKPLPTHENYYYDSSDESNYSNN